MNEKQKKKLNEGLDKLMTDLMRIHSILGHIQFALLEEDLSDPLAELCLDSLSCTEKDLYDFI